MLNSKKYSLKVELASGAAVTILNLTKKDLPERLNEVKTRPYYKNIVSIEVLKNDKVIKTLL